jgi:hypothetical protein
MSKLQGLALQAARGSEHCHRNQTGKAFAKETSTTLSSHQFLLLVYDASERQRVRFRRCLSDVPPPSIVA